MSVRKYLISRLDFRSAQRWDVQGGRDIEPGILHSVTAYDARDVDPLVEAVGALLAATFTHDHVLALRTALKPFATQPEEEQR